MINVEEEEQPLYQVQAGLLFMYKETIALKTEYRTEQGAIKAYILGTGEFFWGGTRTAEEQCKLLVKVVNIL